jgi:hypothetical protein
MLLLGPPTHPESDGPGEVAALLMGPAALLFLECKALEKRTLRSLLRAKLRRWSFCGSRNQVGGTQIPLVRVMSALLPKADIAGLQFDVRFVPN